MSVAEQLHFLVNRSQVPEPKVIFWFPLNFGVILYATG